MSSVFLDANIIIDLIDADRNNNVVVKKTIDKLIDKRVQLYTSCDIFTTVYYVASKKINHFNIINSLELLLKIIQIIPIDSAIIKKALHICSSEKNSDFEDVLQYVCAKTFDCDLILTNDHDFYSPDIRLVGCK